MKTAPNIRAATSWIGDCFAQIQGVEWPAFPPR